MAETSMGGTRRVFEQTRWTEVLEARDRKKLGVLVDRYWKPCYFYIRRRGHDVEDAKDLTQAFFADIIERDALAAVTRSKGRFRSFLLACLDHYLANEYDRRKAKKRSAKLVPLDFEVAETQFRQTKSRTPEDAFTRQWAVGLIDKAMAALKKEMGPRFDVLKDYITAGATGSIRDVAGRLKLTESNVKVIVHRARGRYRDLLKEEVARTVDSPREIDDELKEVFAALT